MPTSPSDNRVIVDVSLDIGVIPLSVMGGSGMSSTETYQNNAVYLLNGLFYSQPFYGTFSSVAALTTDNSVTISGGMVGEVHGAHIESTTNVSTVSYNTVNINNGATTNLFGGSIQYVAAYDPSTAISAKSNTVNINDGTITGNVTGGFVSTPAGSSAIGNTVNIRDGTIDGMVFGGYSVCGSSCSNTVRDNTINISGGTITGDVFGGFAINDYEFYNAVASGNTITISGTPTIGGSLVGGLVIGTSTGMSSWGSTNNTLNLKTHLSVAGLQFFQNLNFTLPGDIDGATPLLTVGANGITNMTPHVDIRTPAGSLSDGSYILLRSNTTQTLAGQDDYSIYGTTLDASHEATLDLASGRIQGTFKVGTNGTDLMLAVSDYSAPLKTDLIWKGSVDTAWINFSNTSPKNWESGGSPIAYFDGDTVTFDDTATAFGVVIDKDGVSPGVVNFNNAGNNYTLTGGAVTGTALSKTGDGKLVLANDNSYTAGVAVAGGILQIGDSTIDEGRTGSLTGNVTLSNDTQVIFDSLHGQTYAGDIGGSGSLEKNGAGMLTLTGNHTYTGPTTLSAGTLMLGDGVTTGHIENDIVIENAPSALIFFNSDASTHTGVIRGAGALEKIGRGILTLTETNLYEGGTAIYAGLINFWKGENLGQSNILLNGGGLQWAIGNTLDISGRLDPLGVGGGVFDTNGNEVKLETALSGTGRLTKTGNGTLTLTQANDYAGGTVIDAGILNLTGSLTSAVTVNDTATFALTGTAQDAVTLGAGSTLEAYKGGTITGALSATSATLDFIMQGISGDPLLNVGSVTTASSHFNIQTPGGTLSDGDYILMRSTGTQTLEDYGNYSLYGKSFGNGYTLTLGSGRVHGAFTVKLDNNSKDLVLNVDNYAFEKKTLVWKGDNNQTTWLRFNADTPTENWFEYEDPDETPIAYFDGDNVIFNDDADAFNVVVDSTGVSPDTVTFNNSDGKDYTFTGGTVAGTSLIKNGTGALTLDNDSIYTAGTTLNEGRLNLTGHLQSDVTVGNSATFALRGGVGGDVTLSGGGFHAYRSGRITGNLSATNAALTFYLPQDIANGATLLTVDGATTIIGSAIQLLFESRYDLTSLASGEKIKLIDAGAGTDFGALSSAPVPVEGATRTYNFKLSAEGNVLWATLMVDPGPKPLPTKSLAEGNLAGTALLNQGADLSLGEGITAALAPENTRAGLHIFAALGGGRLRHGIGSRLHVEGSTLISGFTATRAVPAGNFTFGAFFEGGEGHYNSHTHFTHGKGRVDYSGVGILAHLESSETERGHFFTEATARAGRVGLDFKSDDPDDAYRSRTGYESASFGLGYVVRLGESYALKLSGQYLWSRQGSDTVKLGTGDSVKFEAIASHRARLSTRWSWNPTPGSQLYFGAAWEREYDGRAKASTSNTRLTTPKLTGDTAVIETGVTLKPTPASPWTLDFNLQSHTGRRKGTVWGFEVNYRF